MSARQVSYSFLQHWLEYLLAIAAVIGLCFFVVQWAMPGVSKFISANWTWLAVAGIALLFGATSPWTAPAVFRAYRAIRLHKEEVENSKSYRALLQASTQALKDGADLEYKNARTGDEVKVKYPTHSPPARVQVQEIAGSDQLALPAPQESIPAIVRYADVCDEVPDDMSLLGIHPSDGSLELSDWENLKCMWVIGSSSTGKSNTVYGKGLEAYNHRAKFLIVDQHAVKEDSLARKLAPLSAAFLRPVATTDEEVIATIQMFKAEFDRRVHGASCEQKIVLIVDEVNRMARNPTLLAHLKEIVAICGEESRGFGMYGWFISQKAVHLKWLRDSAITVIVHRVTRFEEAMLACNDDRKCAQRLLKFPVGRSFIYGVDFDDLIELQQPLYEVVESAVESVEASTAEYEESVSSCDGPYATTVVEPLDRTLPFDVEKFKQARKMLLEQCTQNKIICTVWDVAENTRAFRTAREELKLMLAYLASMAEV